MFGVGVAWGMTMTNRVVTVYGAVFLGCLATSASSAVFAAPAAAAAEADACLSGPKGAAPQGERWYYRVERGTKRHCWYTRAQTPGNVATKTRPATPAEDTDSAMADNTPPATSPSAATQAAATPPQPAPPAPLQPAVANARAELARSANSAAAPSPSPFPPPPVMSAPSAQPAAAMPQPAATPDLQQADASPQPSDTMATAAPPTVAATTPPARAESTPLWVLLSVIGGVLAMVGIITALIRMFAGSAQYHRRDVDRAASRWEHEPFAAPPAANADPEPQATIVDDAPVMKMDMPPMNWVRIARENAGQPDEEIEQLLSRRARPAA